MGIEEISFSRVDGRQRYRIDVQMGAEIDEKQMETMFVDIMRRINREPLSEYLKARDKTNWLSIEIHFLGIPDGTFFSGSYKRLEWFTSQHQREQVWENRGLKKEYRYCDYMQ